MIFVFDDAKIDAICQDLNQGGESAMYSINVEIIFLQNE